MSIDLTPTRTPDFAMVSTVFDGKVSYVKPWGLQSDPMRYSMVGAREEVKRLKFYVARCKRNNQPPSVRPNCIVRVYLK